MVEERKQNVKVGKSIAEAIRRETANLAGCLVRVCNELDSMNDRVGQLEADKKALELRLFALELRCGAVKTQVIAEASFGSVQQMPEVSMQ